MKSGYAKPQRMAPAKIMGIDMAVPPRKQPAASRPAPSAGVLPRSSSKILPNTRPLTRPLMASEEITRLDCEAVPSPPSVMMEGMRTLMPQ